MISRSSWTLFAPLLLLAIASAAAPAVPYERAAPAATLARDGQALLPIQISAAATERERAAATTLAEYLGKMSGAEFKVETVVGPLDAKTGIEVGLAAHFAPGAALDPTADPTLQEQYLLRTSPRAVTIAAVGELGLEDAVWDFLYRLGYRQYFPGTTWEIVPRLTQTQMGIDTLQQPAYLSRRIWYGFGPLPENRQQYDQWSARNRVVEGINLNTSHTYGAIIRRNREAFDTHPEYYALVNGKRDVRPDAKFCISNPGLRALVVADALKSFADDPSKQSISIEPSDGGGWCQCAECAKLGSVSDRAVTLANAVAEAVTAKYPGKFIGMYAYNEHSPPPNIAVNPHVVVSVATSFIRGGYTLDQLLTGWHQQGATLGIREYYEVNPWDRDLPGQARGGNLDYLSTTIPHFAASGARFLSAESGDSWGPYGLGYYLASRYFWNPDEAARKDALVDDFLTRCFGPAKGPMAEWYRAIDGSGKPLVSEDLIGRMYRRLDEASRLTIDPAIRARIADLVLYTHYADLYQRYSQASGVNRQTAFEELLRFSYRIRHTGMTHTLGLWRDLDGRDKTVSLPDGAGWNVKEPKNPWKSSAPFTPEEIQGFLAQGIATNPLLDFEPKAFSDELVPATPLHLTTAQEGDFGYTRGGVTFWTWAENAPATFPLSATAGIVYGDRGAAKLSLFPRAETLGQSVSGSEISPDKQPHEVELKTNFAGLHRIELTDGSSGTAISWRAGNPTVIESSLAQAPRFGGRWGLFFYVPRGTKTLGGFSTGSGDLLDGDGKRAFVFAKEGYWNLPVPPGQDGKLWKFSNSAGQRMLMTVPPYLARSAGELLLPREVVEADKTP